MQLRYFEGTYSIKCKFKMSRLGLLQNWIRTVGLYDLQTSITQIRFSLQSEMHGTDVHLLSRVHYISEAVIAFHRNCAVLYFIASASLHNVALVNCWSIEQRLHAVVCMAVIYQSFLRLRFYCVTITRMLTAVDISLQIISSCFRFLLLYLFPHSSSLFSFRPFLFLLFWYSLTFSCSFTFSVKKIHNFSRIMKHILTRVFVKTGLNMSSMDKAARSKGLMCYGCLPTPSIYAFHVTVTEEICYFLTQHESTGVFCRRQGQ